MLQELLPIKQGVFPLKRSHKPVHCSRFSQINRTGELLGFSLVEVMVAMLVAAIFVSLSMQVIVTAAAFRAIAAQYDEAYNWIQKDLETVVNKASQYELKAYPYSTKCGATSAANGFAAGFMNDATAGLDGASNTFGPKIFGGKSYMLLRTADYSSSSDPFKLLQLTYTVIPEGGGKPIATVNSEVIPQAVLKCY